jgi:hypothetical protein
MMFENMKREAVSIRGKDFDDSFGFPTFHRNKIPNSWLNLLARDPNLRILSLRLHLVLAILVAFFTMMRSTILALLFAGAAAFAPASMVCST